jgi:hypothetical protein
MKQFLFSIPGISILALVAHIAGPPADSSPLAEFSSEWNEAKYLKCNTGANTGYLSVDEKKIIYILNLARANPSLFAKTVVAKYPNYRKRVSLMDVPEFRSLLDTLQKIQPLPLLLPDSLCFESAKCHALSSGEKGYVGHERQTPHCATEMHHQGECCQYGYTDPLQIVMTLLIDEKIPSLGHRFICLSRYQSIGVAIQPHSQYGHNTVIDFHF